MENSLIIAHLGLQRQASESLMFLSFTVLVSFITRHSIYIMHNKSVGKLHCEPETYLVSFKEHLTYISQDIAEPPRRPPKRNSECGWSWDLPMDVQHRPRYLPGRIKYMWTHGQPRNYSILSLCSIRKQPTWSPDNNYKLGVVFLIPCPARC